MRSPAIRFLKAGALPKSLASGQVHRAAEDSFQQRLRPRHAEQGHGPIGAPVQHEVDVATRTQLIARQRAEQRDMRDARGPEVVGMGAWRQNSTKAAAET